MHSKINFKILPFLLKEKKINVLIPLLSTTSKREIPKDELLMFKILYV